MLSLVKTSEEIAKITESGRILGFVLRKLKDASSIGTSLLELDKLAREIIIENGAQPAFLGYKPDGAKTKYPYTLCASINEVIVHGQPSAYKLQSGDILKLDLGVNFEGGITDAAITVPIGKVSKEDLYLIKITKNALNEAVKVIKPGHTIGDISSTIEKTVTAGNAKVIKNLTGHGVGNELHEDPVIFNYGEPGTGIKLKAGMVLAIEPMTSFSSTKAVQCSDDSYITSDKSNSAHFEHTVLVTETGAKILTE